MSDQLEDDPEVELIQVVDENNEPLCGLTREEIHARQKFHRAVHVLLFNKSGDLYLQRRAASKDTWAGFWDSSCAGHVRSGESYDDAAARELMEELGVSGLIRPIGSLPASEETGLEFVQVYAIDHDGEIHPNPSEIDEGRFIPINQVRLELKTKSRPFTPCFDAILKLYLAHSPTVVTGSSE